MHFHWWENGLTGLPLTRFHRIVVPFEPFDTGRDWVPQPESPELTLDWIRIPREDPGDLRGVTLEDPSATGDLESSVYIGHSHNWFAVSRLTLTRIDGDRYELHACGTIEFSTEGVGPDEPFELRVEVEYCGQHPEWPTREQFDA